MPNVILEDKREIRAIWPIDSSGLGWNTEEGPYGMTVDRIEAYGEPGQGATVPWFLIWKEGAVIERVNAAAIEQVVYKEKPVPVNDNDMVF